MSDLSTAIVLKALDGLSLRAEATAQNIASAGSTGYRPVKVSFEAALAAAAGRGQSAVDAVRPKVERDAAVDLALGGDGGVRLDMEVATSAATAARYGALVELLGRQQQIRKLAVTGGA